MENLNNPEVVNRAYVFHREIKEGPQGPQKGDYFKIFLRENNQNRYYIKFEIPPEEKNLDDFTIFRSFLKKNFAEEDPFLKNVDEVVRIS